MSTCSGEERARRARRGLIAAFTAAGVLAASVSVAAALVPEPGGSGSPVELRRAPTTEPPGTTSTAGPGPTTSLVTTTVPRPDPARTAARAAPRDPAPSLPEEVSELLGGGPWSSSEGAHAPVASVHEVVVRVRVTLRSSADWAALQLPAPTQVVNAALLDETRHDLFWRGDGIVVSTPADRFEAPAVVDVLLASHPVAPQRWRVLLPRGVAGGVDAVGLNDLTRPVELAHADATGPHRDVVVDGVDVARHGPLRVGASEHRGLVLANFVPWHPDGDYERFNNRPADPSAKTTDPAYVGRAIASARDAGIDGFMVSYFGLPHADVDAYFEASRRVPGWRSALMLETKVANAGRTWRQKPDPAVLETWIRAAMDRFGDHPSLLRLADGRAVFFAYRADLVPAEAWHAIVDRSAARGQPVAIIGSDMRTSYLGALSGLFTYNSLDYEDLGAAYRLRSDLARTDHLLHPDRERKLWVATVTPGMNYTGPALEPRVYDRRGGERYREQWEAALASGADWVLVVTWNDYAEETTIEASREWGDTYLRLTRRFSQ